MASKPRNPLMNGSSGILVTAAMIILSSCSSNLLVVCQVMETTWTTQAAEAAEAVAGKECSGHGRTYLDGLLLLGSPDNLPICECNACYFGANCSQFQYNCSAKAASGDPYFLEPFWMNRSERSAAVLVSGYHRMGYTFSDKSFISEVLMKRIQQLHGVVGNAATEGRFIVFGAGITQLLNAAVHALSLNPSLQSLSKSPAKVVVTAPYYPLYKRQTEFFNSVDYKFEGDTSFWKNKSLPLEYKFIEFVTSPTNPEGRLTKAVLEGPNVKAIYDHAYYWPHYTPIPSPSDQEIMIFSLSKLTGHAGSRFGWALVKDEAVYQKMTTYLHVNTLGVSRDAQLRALTLLDVVLYKGDNGTEIFRFGSAKMNYRWDMITKILSQTKRFSLQNLTPQNCTLFKTVRSPTPAYAWLKCERQEDKNCTAVLENANIIGSLGSKYGANESYVRLSLIKTHDDFQMLLRYLQDLVAKS